MATRIRLKRIGKRNYPVFRVVIAEKASKRDGKVLAQIGLYTPKAPQKFRIDHEAYAAWYKRGARPTETVQNLLNQEGKRA